MSKPKFYYPNPELIQIEEDSFLGGIFSACSAKAPGKTGNNEDSFALISIDSETGIIVVADGAGGHPGGDVASALVLSELLKASESKKTEKPHTRTIILNAIEKTNEQLLQAGSGAATTAEIVEIAPSFIRSYHVGDSTSLLVGNRGKLKFQTVSHSPTGLAVKSGILSEEQALVHEENHIVFNLVGMKEMEIAIGPKTPISSRDTLLISSDGLTDNLPTEEILEIVRKGSLKAASQLLFETTQKRMQEAETLGTPGKPDDLTFLLYRSAN